MDQVIAGLADPEIRRDVPSHPNAKDLTLETLLIFIEGKESGQESQGLLADGSTGVALLSTLTRNVTSVVTATREKTILQGWKPQVQFWSCWPFSKDV